MTLHPDFRSNTAFAIAFFLTRILFHIILGISYFLHDNRTQATGGSYLPSLLLATILPLHVMWFYGCIQGFYRRASQRHTPIDEVVPVDRKVSPPPETQGKRAAQSRPSSSSVVDNRHSTNSTDATPSPTIATFDSKLEHSKLQVRSRRFYSRSVTLSSNDSRFSVTGKLRTKLYASLPNREVVFDYVGLGRGGSKQEQWWIYNVYTYMLSILFLLGLLLCTWILM